MPPSLIEKMEGVAIDKLCSRTTWLSPVKNCCGYGARAARHSEPRFVRAGGTSVTNEFDVRVSSGPPWPWLVPAFFCCMQLKPVALKEPDIIMIGLVIFEGMASGCRRSKGVFSRMIGISRASLGRRLGTLERDGHIVREGKGFLATPHKFNALRRMQTRSLIDAFIQLGQGLSNLDNNH
jgi:hypothetical protein